MKFYNTQGQVSDALDILKENGFNYIRLRIFHDPKSDSAAYSPLYGFCDLENTLKMAKRVKKSGMKFLLDFHYSDTWADPQKQFTPRAWSSLDYATLKDSVFRYTLNVMRALKNQGTEPDMVQIGNEINHGILWPDGAINNLDSLAGLLYAGIKASKEVNPSVLVMLHIALGGQNEESRFFLDQMALRKVPFDILGLSYYPKWHGSPSDLRNNIRDLSRRYSKPIIIAEYSALKKEVNEIAFTAAGKKSLGSFIWEPLNTWEFIFNRNGKPNDKMNIYPVLAKKYLRP
jgi:beta-galactosidase